MGQGDGKVPAVQVGGSKFSSHPKKSQAWWRVLVTTNVREVEPGVSLGAHCLTKIVRSSNFNPSKSPCLSKQTKNKAIVWSDGWVGKASCCQAWRPEFDPWRENWFPKVIPRIPHAHHCCLYITAPPMNAHMRTYTVRSIHTYLRGSLFVLSLCYCIGVTILSHVRGTDFILREDKQPL